MKLPSLIIALALCLLGSWAVGAAYIFAPHLFASLDVSDMLSGLTLFAVAFGGNMATLKGI